MGQSNQISNGCVDATGSDLDLLNFCKQDGRILQSPEERDNGLCRYCYRGIAANTSAFFSTFRATMNYTVQSVIPRRVSKSRRLKPSIEPHTDLVTWADSSPDFRGHLASTTMKTREIHFNWEGVTRGATKTAKVTKGNIEDSLSDYIATIQVHELIHAVGQVGHTTQRSLGYKVASNRAFDKVISLMGHTWGTAINKGVADLDEVNTDLPNPHRTLDKVPAPESLPMSTNLTTEKNDPYPTTADDWARVYAAKKGAE